MKKISHFICTSILTVCTFSTASASLLINEIDYDQSKADTAEFIELFNSGAAAINLTGYRLDLINGNSSASKPTYRSFNLNGYSLAAGGYLVICGNASMVMNCNVDTNISSGMIQNGAPDGIILLNDQDIIDAITYEGVIAGITEGIKGALADISSGIMSIGRLPSGQDTDNNAADFQRGCITPGTANISGSGDCSITAAGTVPQPPILWLFASGVIGMLAGSKRK